MTDWTQEEDEAFNEVERQSNLGKQILRDTMNKSSGMDCCTYDCIQGRDCPVRKAKWQGLTNDDKVLIKHDANFNQFMTAGEYADRVQQLTEARLKDLNS